MCRRFPWEISLVYTPCKISEFYFYSLILFKSMRYHQCHQKVSWPQDEIEFTFPRIWLFKEFPLFVWIIHKHEYCSSYFHHRILFHRFNYQCQESYSQNWIVSPYRYTAWSSTDLADHLVPAFYGILFDENKLMLLTTCNLSKLDCSDLHTQLTRP